MSNQFSLILLCILSLFSTTGRADEKDDIEGHQFKVQLDRLEILSKQNLYAEENRRPEDEAVRIKAVREIANFPCFRSARILLERNNYRGVFTDYDLVYESQESIKIVIDKMIQKFGEEKTLSVMTYLYFEDEQYEIGDVMVDMMNEFKTSAALMFVIKNHSYSPTSKGVSNQGILQSIYKKVDFPFFMERYKPQFVDFFKTGAGMDVNDATYIWARERACQSISNHPVSGLISLLWGQIRSHSTDFSLINFCSEAMTKILKDPSLNHFAEIKSLKSELIEVITSTMIPKSYYFPNPSQARAVAALMLGRMQTTEAKFALTKALTIPELEYNVRESILEALTWYK